jgi:phosphotransferase system enzyme I (PtsI)
VGASTGIAIARALVLHNEEVPIFRLAIPRSQVDAECARLDAALRVSLRQLREVRARIAEAVGEEHAYILDAHRLMLEDPLLVEGIRAAIQRESVNAEWALDATLRELAAMFEGLKDDYLRERKLDVLDVGGRILRNLGAGGHQLVGRLERDYVLVAHDVPPSLIPQLDWDHLVGLAIEAGSRTYHTAIMARSMGIPCVVGLSDMLSQIEPEATVVLDGSEGLLFVEPDRALLARYRERRREETTRGRKLRRARHLPARTRDGTELRLQANVDFPEEWRAAVQQGAEGIGLFRSEWFLARSGGLWPEEEEQFVVYREMAEQMSPHPVVVRTFDVGSVQLASDRAAPEPNPALGMRATRLMLVSHREQLKIQLRAILRARAHGDLRVMFPMVSGLEEFRQARAALEEAKEELAASGRDFRPDLPCGLTLEVPSAAATADLLAAEADFFSIGTNDLIQYYLAVDRSNERVSYLYQPLHPAILRAIRFATEAGHREGIPVSVCGEAAAELPLVLLLVGLGVAELSMQAASVPWVKDFIRHMWAAKAKSVAARALEMDSAHAVFELVAGSLEEQGLARPPSGGRRTQPKIETH